MLYLIFAIISSVLISVCMRASEKHITNQMGMFAANYLFACYFFRSICNSGDFGSKK